MPTSNFLLFSSLLFSSLSFSFSILSLFSHSSSLFFSFSATSPIVAVVNPSSGPGSCSNSDYINGVSILREANVEMIGYVFTLRGERSLFDVIDDIDSWVDCSNDYYNNSINGIFVDESSNKEYDVMYYRDVYRKAADAFGDDAEVVLNPGTNVNSPQYQQVI